MSGNAAGNARDNRQRGNATQLLEKYKSMARDAQLAGDRVQTEYYLQFADHYYRVLGESRVRFEEQRRQRGDDGDDDGDYEGEEMAEAEADGEAEPARDERPQRRPRQDRDERPDRSQRFERDRPERAERPQRTERANGRGAPAEERFEADERIAFDVLPPAIGADNGVPPPSDGGEDAVAAAPRRRVRRPKADDNDGDIVPVG